MRKIAIVKMKKLVFVYVSGRRNDLVSTLQVEPLSAISAIWPKATHGHKQVRQPAILIIQ